MIEVRFHPGGYSTGWYKCRLCGEEFKVGLEDPLLVAYSGSKYCGEVCPSCLGDPASRMLDRAAELEKEARRLAETAARLREAAKEEIRRPTLEEYEGLQEKIARSLREGSKDHEGKACVNL